MHLSPDEWAKAFQDSRFEVKGSKMAGGGPQLESARENAHNYLEELFRRAMDQAWEEGYATACDDVRLEETRQRVPENQNPYSEESMS